MDDRVVVPSEENLRTRIILEIHDQQSLAHPSRNKIGKIIKSQYCWQGLTGDVERYIRNCHTCRRAQKPRGQTVVALDEGPTVYVAANNVQSLIG